MTTEKEDIPLVKGLQKLVQSQNRGELAALRSGLGKRPGEAPRMYPFVAKYLYSTQEGDPSMRATFLTASLFALHPEYVSRRSLGAALKLTTKSKHGVAGIEARLTAAINADPEDVESHLTGLIRLCQSAKVPLDWNQFYWDTYHLMGDDDQRSTAVRLRWAKDFWGTTQQTTENKEEETE